MWSPNTAERAGRLPQLERLGFGLVGYGYTTCTENSGPLAGQRECEQFPTG
ncbi:hypothetical protein ACNJ7E_13210 [Rhodococcus sp. NM-2]|uniref:Aconitate hydratase n=2 Tax=Rhodococcus TaxID=1827 RepID=A0A402C273_RHOWR|nr:MULTISPECIES: hypothetical protein [Rhodococcus]EID74462.1 aconitate hydratase [Rhodococcus opacus RKJ300 = JCM 13270]QQZ18543.1 hypothetical protein GO592_41080 [Rhodococcus sp. 21391]GCE37739.1 hypothetical protein Rhow_000585 [Rhodococcus wratislaviensis]